MLGLRGLRHIVRRPVGRMATASRMVTLHYIVILSRIVKFHFYIIVLHYGSCFCGCGKEAYHDMVQC